MATSIPSASQRLFIVIDGNALIHRAFHAVPEDMVTSQGEVTNATFGFATMLLKLLRDQRPSHIAVAFDRPTPTFRHLAVESYKAQRPAMPEHLRSQFGRVRQFVQALNIPIYEIDGYEADDVIGALSIQATASSIDTLIVTGDKDTMQLVDDHVRVLTPQRTIQDVTLYDIAAVEEKFGVPPLMIPDWKGLAGDPSDNIPGVPGIGAKTATALLAQYGSVESIFEHLPELSARQQKLLEGKRDIAIQSKWLATIVREVPVQLDLSLCQTHDFDPQTVRNLFKELEFRSLLPRLEELVRLLHSLPSISVSSEAKPETGDQLSLFGNTESINGDAKTTDTSLHGPPDTRTIIIQSVAALEELAEAMTLAGAFSFDVETDSSDEIQAGLVGISLAITPAAAYYIPLGHQVIANEEPPSQLPLGEVQRILGPVFAHAALRKYAHNGKFDMTVLERHGMPVANLTFDTMIAAYLLSPGTRALGLKELSTRLLHLEVAPITTLIGTGAKQITMAQVPVSKAAHYAGIDADMTLRLQQYFAPQLRQQKLEDLFTSVEMPLVPVLSLMEQAGVLIDPVILDQMRNQLDEQIKALEEGIHAAVGHSFNINSPKQLGELLFGELRLPAGRKTKTGHSVDVDVLEGLREAHPVVELLLEYRTLTKLKSTYVEGLKTLINPHDGRVHTSFNQTIASSGRLSSSNPNLQNIPIRTEVGRQIRRVFIAAPRHHLLAADYSQVELRILAHITRDPALVEAFSNDIDVHSVTAARLFHVLQNEVTKDQRRMAKTVTYAILYGQSPFGLARTSGMSQSDAKAFIAGFYESFPGVREYIDATLKHLHEQGFVQTLLGRKRFMPEINQLPAIQRQAAEREAINMPIQGTNADIIKIAMIRLSATLQEQQLKTRMILQVHDELVFEVPDDELPIITPLVRQHMEQAYTLSVPLRVEMKVGPNWYSVEKMA